MTVPTFTISDSNSSKPARQHIRLNTGLKLAPEIGTNKVIRTNKPQPVAILLPSKAIAALAAVRVRP